MDPLALGAAVSLGATVFAIGLAVALGTGSSVQIRTRLEGALSGEGAVEVSPIDPLRRIQSAAGVYQLIISGAWLERVDRSLRLADSQLKPIDFLAIRVAMAGLGFAVPYLFVGGILGLAIAVGAALFGYKAPQMWINRRVQSRAKKLEDQLPEALTMISNSLKAGFGLLQSLDLAVEQLAHPIATELGQTVHETNVGSSIDQAFLDLGERCDSYDLDLVVTAVLVQRASGGNLAEILSTVAETMRERVRIRNEIVTLTAQQKLTGIVIGLLPVGVGLLFLVSSPEYISPLFTETIGRVMLGGAVVLESVGIMVIQRILDIDV
ncbi:MAG: type II secretion system F family protein [Chloroflexi bacterium]|nr:type II secretion system F family protein [Chloroflexota bacterium]